MSITTLLFISRSRHIRLLIPLIGIDLMFFTISNPSRGQLIVIGFGVALLLSTICAASWWLAHTLARIRLVPKEHTNLAAFLMASVASYTLIMQSIGEFNARDVAALVPLVTVLYFYLIYNRKVPDAR